MATVFGERNFGARSLNEWQRDLEAWPPEKMVNELASELSSVADVIESAASKIGKDRLIQLFWIGGSPSGLETSKRRSEYAGQLQHQILDNIRDFELAKSNIIYNAIGPFIWTLLSNSTEDEDDAPYDLLSCALVSSKCNETIAALSKDKCLTLAAQLETSLVLFHKNLALLNEQIEKTAHCLETLNSNPDPQRAGRSWDQPMVAIQLTPLPGQVHLAHFLRKALQIPGGDSSVTLDRRRTGGNMWAAADPTTVLNDEIQTVAQSQDVREAGQVVATEVTAATIVSSGPQPAQLPAARASTSTGGTTGAQKAQQAQGAVSVPVSQHSEFGARPLGLFHSPLHCPYTPVTSFIRGCTEPTAGAQMSDDKQTEEDGA